MKGYLPAYPLAEEDLWEKYLTGKISTPARQEMEKRMLEADFSDGSNLTPVKKK